MLHKTAHINIALTSPFLKFDFKFLLCYIFPLRVGNWKAVKYLIQRLIAR